MRARRYGRCSAACRTDGFDCKGHGGGGYKASGQRGRGILHAPPTMTFMQAAKHGCRSQRARVRTIFWGLGGGGRKKGMATHAQENYKYIDGIDHTEQGQGPGTSGWDKDIEHSHNNIGGGQIAKSNGQEGLRQGGGGDTYIQHTHKYIDSRQQNMAADRTAQLF